MPKILVNFLLQVIARCDSLFGELREGLMMSFRMTQCGRQYLNLTEERTTGRGEIKGHQAACNTNALKNRGKDLASSDQIR